MTRQTMNLKRLLLAFVIALSSVMQGCGFKLKGQYYLPDSLKSVYVYSEKRFNPVLSQVKTRLKQNNVYVLSKINEQKAQLKLLPESFQRRTLSLFPNGQVAEYELIYIVKYQVFLPNKSPQNFSVELSREFQDDPNNALAKERERALILSELRVIASDRIMAQLIMVK